MPAIMVDPVDMQLKPLPGSLTLLDGRTYMGDADQSIGVKAGSLIPQPIRDLMPGFVRQWGTPQWSNAGDGTALPVFTDVSQEDIDIQQAALEAQKEAQQAAHEAQQQAQAAQAAQASIDQYNAAIAAVVPFAQLYRSTLQSLFGAGAETNQNISQAYVEGYFGNLIATNGILTNQQLTQLTVLREGFTELSKFTSDGTTWKFPWSLIP